MTTSELQHLLVAKLLRQHGGTQRGWRLAIGPVTVHDRATHPHCNWSVAPTGTAGQIGRIERLLDDVRLEYPLVVR